MWPLSLLSKYQFLSIFQLDRAKLSSRTNVSYKTWIGNKIVCLLWTNWVLSCKFMNEILCVTYLTHICVLKSFAKLVNSTTSLRCNLRIWFEPPLSSCIGNFEGAWMLLFCVHKLQNSFLSRIQFKLFLSDVWICLYFFFIFQINVDENETRFESKFEIFLVVLKTQNWEILPGQNLRLILLN